MFVTVIKTLPSGNINAREITLALQEEALQSDKKKTLYVYSFSFYIDMFFGHLDVV